MLFIIAGHMIMWHNFQSDNVGLFISTAIRPFFCVAVNCFVLISGWFGIKTNWKKLLHLNWITTFWAIALCILALLIGIHQLELKKDILMLIPVVTRRYWFITVYIALCILAPYLNILIEKISKEEYKKLLITSICLFAILPTFGAIFNFESLTIDCGYGMTNFIVLYLLGRYMRLYQTPKKSATYYFAVYGALMLACGVFQVLYSWILGFEFTALLSYDTSFIFFGAVALFCAFSQLRFRNRIVNVLARFCLVVYIIHMHPWTAIWFYEEFLNLQELSDVAFIVSLTVIPIATFLLCSFLEFLRQSTMRFFCHFRRQQPVLDE